MLRTLMTKRWLTWLLVATVWALACLFLGRWQWQRWEEKSTTEHRISTNYDAPAVALDSVMTPQRALDKQDEWKQVRVTGRYVGPTQLVRNRPDDGGTFGYEVVNVFDAGGTQVLVDRGWIPNGTSASVPSSVPSAPSGELTVVGWARPSEKSLHRAPIPGQLSSISVTDVDARYRDHLVQGYLRMRSEHTADGTSPAHPKQLGKPSQGMAAGINMSYAFQWWAGGIAGYLFVILRARREHLDELATRPQGAHGGRPDAGGADDAGALGNGRADSEHAESHPDAAHPGNETATPGTRPSAGQPARRRRTPKPKKQRIWDEEDA